MDLHGAITCIIHKNKLIVSIFEIIRHLWDIAIKTKFYLFLPKVYQFRHICFVAKASQQVTTASAFDALHLHQT